MRVVICTPAGRKNYLEILKEYIIKNELVDEWHLWQNCRNRDDLEYLKKLSESSKKILIIEADNVDGTNKSVNKFYKFCNQSNTFYIKVDDDILYVHPKTIDRLLNIAIEEKNRYLYWSPIVINNAVCSAVLSAKGILTTGVHLSAQASDGIGWASPFFALKLHESFLQTLKDGLVEKILFKDRISLGAQRFSINCIGFWGDTVLSLGDEFCPSDVDDEEWISATLPIRYGLPGRLIGEALVAHYSFYTQEQYLNRYETIMKEYRNMAGLTGSYISNKKNKLRLFQPFRAYARDYLNNKLGIYKPSQTKKLFVKFHCP